MTHNERIYHQARFSTNIQTCKGCGARILWMKTLRGKNIPVDPQLIHVPREREGTLLDKDGIIHRSLAAGQTGWTPHWVTCPKAEQFHQSTNPKGVLQ